MRLPALLENGALREENTPFLCCCHVHRAAATENKYPPVLLRLRKGTGGYYHIGALLFYRGYL